MVTVIHVERTGTGLGNAPSSPNSHEGDEARAFIRVDNISHILSAYGVAATQTVIAHLDLALDQLRAAACSATTHRPGLVEISFGHHAPATVAAMIEALLHGLSIEPVRLGDMRFHLALSCAMPDTPQGYALPAYEAAGDGEAWAGPYRASMALAVEALAALRAGGLQMHWQPIRSATTPGDLLYSEGLARLAGEDGRIFSPSAFVPALEHVGLVRLFDRKVVAAVLDALEAAPDAVLGVNISAQSACLDGWWDALFSRLRQVPDLARRLVVEITETAAPAAGIQAFVRALRGLGCRVALDDFGAGHASVATALAIAPDIIKIDAFFLHQAGLTQGQLAFFEHLIGIAGTLAPVVVVEGVELSTQSQLAAQAQARFAPNSPCWQQGHYHGRASAWLSESGRQDGDMSIQPVPLQAIAAMRRTFRPTARFGRRG